MSGIHHVFVMDTYYAIFDNNAATLKSQETKVKLLELVLFITSVSRGDCDTIKYLASGEPC